MANAALPHFRLTNADIDRAFEQNQFRVVFQPKVDMRTEVVTGVETFVRWQHPQFGLLPPGLFLDFVESQNRAGELTYFVMANGIKAAAAWRAAGRDWSLSVNVSPSDLMAEDFCEAVVELSQQYQVPPAKIIIEVPERALAQDAETLLVTLDDLRTAGFHVALDGGGIVPIDLTRYQPVPFTSIKVGGQAMLRLAERLGLNGFGAISARLRFAQSQGLEAVAVGAESEETIARLKKSGFTAVQGIWIQRPLPLEELLAWNGAWVRGAGDHKPAPIAAAKPISVAAATPAPEPVKPTAPEPAAAARRSRLSPEVLAKLKAQVSKSEELLDVVEEEDAPAPRHHGAPGEKAEACMPMVHLVQRRTKDVEVRAPRGDGNRRTSILDPIFGN